MLQYEFSIHLLVIYMFNILVEPDVELTVFVWGPLTLPRHLLLA